MALINMELEEANLDGVKLDETSGTLLVPDEHLEKLELLKEIVAKAGNYTLIIN